jgi:hypothetical protein
MRESCTFGSVRGAPSDRRLHSTLPFERFLSLGGGSESEEISEIRVVWGKAVAVSRYQFPALLERCGGRPAPHTKNFFGRLCGNFLRAKLL